MKPYQVNLVAAAMFGDAEKIIDAVETRLARRSCVTSFILIGSIESTTMWPSSIW